MKILNVIKSTLDDDMDIITDDDHGVNDNDYYKS